jgi:hypothetical protein
MPILPPGADARQHFLIAGLEPEAVAGLALVAVLLLDAINRGHIAEADPAARDLINHSLDVEDAARGASDLLPPALAGLLDAAGQLLAADGGSHV